MNVSPGNGGRVVYNGIKLPSYPSYVPLSLECETILEAVPTIGYRFDNWTGEIYDDRIDYYRKIALIEKHFPKGVRCNWFHTGPDQKVMRPFLEDLFEHPITGYRIVRFTNASTGYPVVRFDVWHRKGVNNGTQL